MGSLANAKTASLEKEEKLQTRTSITAPIASATSLEQLHDLIAATKLEPDRASIELLNQASAA